MIERLQHIKTRTYDFSKDDRARLIRELEKERRRLTNYLDLHEQGMGTSLPRFIF